MCRLEVLVLILFKVSLEVLLEVSLEVLVEVMLEVLRTSRPAEVLSIVLNSAFVLVPLCGKDARALTVENV